MSVAAAAEWDDEGRDAARRSGFAALWAAWLERRRHERVEDVYTEHTGMKEVTNEQAQRSIELLQDLASRLSKRGRAELHEFAVQFGPLTLRLAAGMKVAQLMGDNRRAAEIELELDEVIATARLKAARLGVEAHAGVEQWVEFSLQALLRSAVAFL